MSKPNPRRLADNEAQAINKQIKTSPQKLNLVAAMIRGRTVEEAQTMLSFSKRRVAGEVKKTLQSAVANAEHNHELDPDRLIVAEAYVGKSLVLRRFRARARGRTGRILKKFSRITIVVRESEELV